MKRVGLLLVLVTVSVPAFAFVRTASDSGADLAWDHRQLTWMLHQPAPPSTSIAPSLQFGDALVALKASFDTWHNVACTNLSFMYEGPSSRIDVGFNPGASDNINLLVFRDKGLCGDSAVVPPNDPCHSLEATNVLACANVYNCWSHDSGIYALTTTTYDTETGILADADTEYNATPTIDRFTTAPAGSPTCPSATDFTTTGCIAVDVQNTATHEIGHYLGLGHSTIPTATMFATAPLGETTKRILSTDDIDGICSIYPRVTFSGGGGSGCSGAGASVLGAIAAGASLLRRRRRSL